METTITGYTQCNSSGNAASYDVIPNKMLRELIASFSVKNLGPNIPYQESLVYREAKGPAILTLNPKP